jgi:uncharacterized membrane protein
MAAEEGGARAGDDGPGASPRLAGAARGLTLLALEGFSLGLALGFVLIRPRLGPYVLRNELPVGDRNRLVAWAVGLAAAFAAAGLVRLWRDPTGGVATVQAWSRRLAPGLLAWLPPVLVNRWVWVGHDLPFLSLVALAGLGTAQLLPGALGAGGPGRAWTRRAGGGLARLAGRLPGGWPWAAVVLAAVVYAAFFASHTVVHHWNLRSTSFDLAIFDNLMWNLVHGGPFLKSSPALGPTGSHAGRHATFFAYVLAPVYAIAPGPATLLITQAAVIGAGAIPLFLYARPRLGEAGAVVVALAYLLYAPLHGANLYDFHFLSLAPGFVFATLWLLDTRRDGWAAVAVLLTLSLREDVAAGLVVVGLSLLLSGRRPVAGLVLAGVAGIYFAAMKLVLMPALGGDATFVFVYRDLLPPGEDGVLGVVRTLVANPAYVLGTLLDADKLVYVLHVLVPVVFLPLRTAAGWLLMAPGVVFTLLSTGYHPVIQIGFQYTAHWTSYVFPATVLGLAAAGGGEAARRRPWLVALIASSLLCSYQYGAILQQGTARGGFTRYEFGTRPGDVARQRDLASVLALLPPDAKVVATERLVPQVSGRPDAYTLRIGSFDAVYAVFPMDGRELIWPEEGERLLDLLRSGSFGVLAQVGSFAVAQRGFSTRDNDAVLARLARSRSPGP